MRVTDLPLRTHPNRQYNLYVINYYAHMARQRLERLIGTYGGELPRAVRQELIEISGSIRFLHLMERRAEE